MNGPVAAILSDGRLHLQHGPIDLIIDAEGAGRPVALAAARSRFDTVLSELVSELPALRRPCRGGEDPGFAGVIARRMACAVRPHAHAAFVTPMAAVAGSVADEVLAAMVSAAAEAGLERAYVNNGGDIAFHLAVGRRYDLAVGREGWPGAAHGRLAVLAADPVRGIATSGRGGRSLSLGIAEAVTVLAAGAAAADAAATLIANSVDLPGHPAITRHPAAELDPDSDLGQRPVVTACGPLAAAEVGAALERGLALARQMQAAGLIAAAALFLQGESRVLESRTMGGPALVETRARPSSEEDA